MQKILQQQAIIQQLQQIPPQVELQKPVILLDACGRLAPFHLDFITSQEAFIAVLKIRFKDSGLQKIEDGEFVLEERQRKREIDLSKPWSDLFMPGQRIDMSMIFQRSYTPIAKCHGCGAVGQFGASDFECPNCGINCTRRIQDVENGSPGLASSSDIGGKSPKPTKMGMKRKYRSVTEVSIQDLRRVQASIQDFRRVQIIELRHQLRARKSRGSSLQHTSILVPHNRGAVFHTKAELQETEEMYHQALKKYETTLGLEHISTLDTINKLGNLYLDQGKLQEAEEMYHQALKEQEKVLGSEHPSTLTIIYNLGFLYHDQGKLQEAEKMYHQALMGYEKALGSEHPSTLNVIKNLGILYWKQGKLQEAEEMYHQALQGYVKTLGSEHPCTTTVIKNLDELYKAQGKPAFSTDHSPT